MPLRALAFVCSILEWPDLRNPAVRLIPVKHYLMLRAFDLRQASRWNEIHSRNQPCSRAPKQA